MSKIISTSSSVCSKQEETPNKLFSSGLLLPHSYWPSGRAAVVVLKVETGESQSLPPMFCTDLTLISAVCPHLSYCKHELPVMMLNCHPSISRLKHAQPLACACACVCMCIGWKTLTIGVYVKHCWCTCRQALLPRQHSKEIVSSLLLCFCRGWKRRYPLPVLLSSPAGSCPARPRSSVIHHAPEDANMLT